MEKEIIKAMVTKFSEIFAIIMLKKHRKACRRGLTHLAATSTFQKSFRSFWVTLQVHTSHLTALRNARGCTVKTCNVKFSFSEKATKMCTTVLMVLKFT